MVLGLVFIPLKYEFFLVQKEGMRTQGLPDPGFEIIALPIKTKGGSGAPLRLVALID
jgi:kynurenine formamidase